MTAVHSDSQSKKRKHRPTQSLEAASSKKKEKRRKAAVHLITAEDALPSQETKLTSCKDKGKSRAPDHPSEFHTISASIVLSIPPVFASDMRTGAEEMLDSMVMRYIPSLQGVLLAHSNIQFQSQTASIHGDCPFAVCGVTFDATVWGPRVSMKLVGRINVCSPDHVSLLVHRTFNVSIPRHHIPQDQWLFEYGPAENDPEFGGDRAWNADGATSKDRDVEMNDPTELRAPGDTSEAENNGRWVHHLTGAKLGDRDGYVEFTVIGLTVANEMLSLQGSIQPNPFSPEHVPRPEKESSLTLLQDEIAHDDDEDDDDDDENGYDRLSRLAHEAEVTQKAKRAKR